MSEAFPGFPAREQDTGVEGQGDGVEFSGEMGERERGDSGFSGEAGEREHEGLANLSVESGRGDESDLNVET